ncbi:MAG: hypothetical protein JNJ60_22795 [Rhodocyclaceae bacterium]|nr:hypothetical protein [Rhodocyclaceae bacterium]
MQSKLSRQVTTLLSAACLAVLPFASYAGSVEAAARADAKADYSIAKKQAAADYAHDKAACKDLKDDVREICLKDAKARYKMARADAKAEYKSDKVNAEAAEEKAEAGYKAAKERCETLSGADRTACVAEAKAKYAH